jgi:hypothetical protein
MPKPVKKKRKRTPPRDINQWARHMVEQSTASETEPTATAPAIDPTALSAYMSALGRKGGKASGERRMQNLSEQQRRDIASRAARARWKAVAKQKSGKEEALADRSQWRLGVNCGLRRILLAVLRRFTLRHYAGGAFSPKHISTSYVERENWTVRTTMRRYTRLSNGFSRKLTNHEAAVALNYFAYNFIRIHRTLRVTPAMAAGVTTRLYDVADLVALLVESESKKAA